MPESPERKSGRSYRREHWEGQRRLDELRALADGAETKREREHFLAEADKLIAASQWKCGFCGTTIQELIKEGGPLPYNLTAWYCPGGDCYAEAKRERMREQYAQKKAEKEAAAKKAAKERGEE